MFSFIYINYSNAWPLAASNVWHSKYLSLYTVCFKWINCLFNSHKICVFLFYLNIFCVEWFIQAQLFGFFTGHNMQKCGQIFGISTHRTNNQIIWKALISWIGKMIHHWQESAGGFMPENSIKQSRNSYWSCDIGPNTKQWRTTAN